MDLMEMHTKVQQVENGLKLALLIVGGIAGAIALVTLIGAASVKTIEKEGEARQPSA